LWNHTMPDKPVIFDVLLLVRFIIFLSISNCLFITSTSDIDLFLIAGHPALDVENPWWGCWLKSDMRSGDIARSCSGRLSIGNLQGHTPCGVWLETQSSTGLGLITSTSTPIAIIENHHSSVSSHPLSVYSCRWYTVHVYNSLVDWHCCGGGVRRAWRNCWRTQWWRINSFINLLCKSTFIIDVFLARVVLCAYACICVRVCVWHAISVLWLSTPCKMWMEQVREVMTVNQKIEDKSSWI